MTPRVPPSASTLPAAVAAGQECDDDAAEGDDARDDGLQDAADAANDGHDGVSYCPEKGRDLAGC